MKQFLSIVVIIIIVGIIGAAAGAAKRNSAVNPIQSPISGGLLQSCPDEMIINNMPGPGEQKASYYNVGGVRKEISEYDSAWVAANCNVPTQAVY